jgi:hypothetical protein
LRTVNWADNGPEQQRWVYLFKTRLISKEDADAWAEEVWPSKPDEAILKVIRP